MEQDCSPIAFLVCAFNCRSFSNWRPLCDHLVRRGHAVYTALFPRVSDPDHEGLLRLPYPNLLTSRIDRQFQPIDDDFADVLDALRRAVARHDIDIIWMSTFHGGPEHHIRRAMRDLPRRPIVVGLQHGMAHDWPLFETWSDKFDLLGDIWTSFLFQVQ